MTPADPAGKSAAADESVVTQILPWAKETRLAFKAGEAPLRNRWNGCGMPLAANSVSATFSPFTLLSLLLPLARGYTLTGALRLLLAAAGMWLCTREIGASETSSLRPKITERRRSAPTTQRAPTVSKCRSRTSAGTPRIPRSP